MTFDMIADDNGNIKFAMTENNKIVNLFKPNVSTKRKPSLGLPLENFYNTNTRDLIEIEANQYLINNGIVASVASVVVEGSVAKVSVRSIMNTTAPALTFNLNL